MTPERTCVGCRQRCAQPLLVRLALQGSILTLGKDVPGRGAWLHPTVTCLQLAERKSAFGRALRFSGPIDTAEVRSHLVGLDSGRSAL